MSGDDPLPTPPTSAPSAVVPPHVGEVHGGAIVAAAFILSASAIIAATTLLAKAVGTDALGEPLHPLQITHGRFVFAFIVVGIAALIIRPRFTKPDLALHTARTCCGFGGATLLFTAAIMIPLSDATAISFLSPVVTMVLAVLFLGERVGPWRWIAAAISIAGAAILLRPGVGVVEVGALAALGAALVMGLELTLIKRLAGREKPTQILVINNAIGTALSSIVLIFVFSPPTVAQWAALAALGGLMACAQVCYIFAMRAADASYVAPLAYSTLIFAALYDVLAFGVTPDAVSIIGAATILCGACLLAWRESRAQRRMRRGL